MDDQLKGALDPNEILVAEFNYIAQTAFQANEDRARVSNYYLVTAGAAVAAILQARLEGTTTLAVYWGFAAVFAILSGVGLMTLLQLARLRTAWTASARAMNRIKDYYRDHCPEAKLEEAFAWTTKSLPSPDKRDSVAHLLALSVLLVDGGTAAAAVVFLGVGLAPEGVWLWLAVGLLVAALFAGGQWGLYQRWLRGAPHSPPTALFS